MSPKISDLELACRFVDGDMLGEGRGREEVIKVRWLPTKKDCRHKVKFLCICLLSFTVLRLFSFKILIILRNY